MTERAAASRATALRHLEHAIEAAQHTIEASEALLEGSVGGAAENEQRIIDAETEVAIFEGEREAMRRGDLQALRDASTTMPPPGHEYAPGRRPPPRPR